MPKSRQTSSPVILIHGGAGARRPSPAHCACLHETLRQSYDLLQRGQPADLAVEHAIQLLEASGLFNAGLGPLRQLDGVQRMDAALMEGKDLTAGGVAGLEGYLHPITAARLVMTHTDHVLIIGHHAKRLARHFGLRRLPKTRKAGKRLPVKPPPGRNVHSLSLYKKMGWYDTVGAVALDQQGTLAAGASTGGVPVMLPGRVGDSPLIGSGVYANNEGAAISMTGIGESIIRMGMARWMATMIQQGDHPRQAARKALRALVKRVRGDAGCLILTSRGSYAIQHSTPWMAAGHWNGAGKPVVQERFGQTRPNSSSKQ